MDVGVYCALCFIGYQLMQIKDAMKKQNDIAMVQLTEEQLIDLEDMSQEEEEKA